MPSNSHLTPRSQFQVASALSADSGPSQLDDASSRLWRRDRGGNLTWVRGIMLMMVLLFANESRSQFIADPAEFIPPAPTSQDRIQARFYVPGGCGVEGVSTLASGSVVTTTVVFRCGVGGGPPVEARPISDSFGPLPVGTYTYEIHYAFVSPSFPAEVRSRQTLVVTDPPASIPVLTPWMLAALAVTLGLVAMFRMDLS